MAVATIATATLYRAFGMAISSEIALPLPLADTASSPCWRIVRGSRYPEVEGELIAENRCDEPCHAGAVINRTYRSDFGTWIWSEGTGLYHVSQPDRLVTVYADDADDDRAIGLVLIGQVAVYMLHGLGYPSLHASAVLVDGEAVAFLAPPGSGKSTMAGAFLRRGATLLSDDVLPLVERPEGICALPGAPMMKVWPGTATETFGIHDELPNLTATLSKKLFSLEGRVAFASTPARLRTIYVLRRFDPKLAATSRVQIQQLSQSQAVPLLLAHTLRREMLYPREAARLLPLYTKLTRQASVRLLGVPDGFCYQDEVREQILANLGMHA